MEEPTKEQHSTAASAASSGKPKLLRYALRSATKSKDEKLDSASSSASRRAKPSPTVSKSMGVLDLPGKEKSAKPPRRLSVPAKSNQSSASKVGGNITPISEARGRRSAISRAKTETPLSEVSRSSIRKKYNVLSSTSYWLSQIKVSEYAGKHSISLGFFKLALEAGCEPLQKMREELKSYVQRHNLAAEPGDNLKELLEVYNIVENLEQLQVSEICSQEPDEGTKTSDDDVRSSSSTTTARKLKPKSLNNETALTSQAVESAREPKAKPATKTRESVNKSSAKSRTLMDGNTRNSQRKPQKPVKQESDKEKKAKKQGRKSAAEEGQDRPSLAEDVVENKENMDAGEVQEMTPVEVM